jgi:Amt family ammonium transporter
MFFVFVWHICIYTPVAHITWNVRGFFKTNEIEDFSGGLVVHMTAGITAVTAHLFLDWIQAPKAELRKRNNPKGILFSSILVWVLSFGVNAGKAYMADSVATQSMVNTIAATTVSILVNYFLDELEGFRFRNVSVANYILLGLVSSAPCSGFVSVGGSMVVTIITVLTVRVIGKYLFKEAIDGTPYSIGTLHGLGGTIAFLFTALISYEYINPGNGVNLQALNGLTHGSPKPIRHHVAAILAMWICLFISILVALFICNLIVPLSKSKQSAQSPKGDYAPAPFGPFGKENGEGSAYQHRSNFNIGTYLTY